MCQFCYGLIQILLVSLQLQTRRFTSPNTKDERKYKNEKIHAQMYGYLTHRGTVIWNN